jgi:hypothetical protein
MLNLKFANPPKTAYPDNKRKRKRKLRSRIYVRTAYELENATGHLLHSSSDLRLLKLHQNHE